MYKYLMGGNEEEEVRVSSQQCPVTGQEAQTKTHAIPSKHNKPLFLL